MKGFVMSRKGFVMKHNLFRGMANATAPADATFELRCPRARIKMRQTGAVVGAVAVLLGMAVLAASANASPPTGNVKQIGAGLQSCPKGYFCAWRDVNYNGPGVAFEGNADHWHHLGTLSFIDDAASSMYNNGYASNPSAVRVWVDVGHNGVTGCFSVGTKKAVLQPAFNDKISSHKWVTSCSAPAAESVD
jgi:hypothetical protein